MKRTGTGVTLIEVLVAAGLFAMVITAVLSFYLEAAAVSAKRDDQSQRLRRFHLGLDKLEQMIIEGRVISVGSRLLTLWRLSDSPERNGFPLYDEHPVQFASTREGLLMIQGEEQKNILPLREDETLIFGWVQYNPPMPPGQEALKISLYRYGQGEKSDLLFTRVISLLRY